MAGAVVSACPAGALNARSAIAPDSDEAMQVYAGLDVSLKTTHICLMNEGGKTIWRGVSASDPALILRAQELRAEPAPAGIRYYGCGLPFPGCGPVIHSRLNMCG